MKRIVVLGSSGSIGTQVLDIVNRLPDRLKVVGLAAYSNADVLARQAAEFSVPYVCIGSAHYGEEILGSLARRNTQVLYGVEGMCALASLPEADLVVVAVAGAVGIKPTQAAIAAGKEIALASKEVLVAAGEPTMRLAREHGVAIRPIDSEHSALFQCLQGAPDGSVERLYLTASGGPFRTTSAEALASVTPEEALKHPTWNMGGLVTINSATLMNKGLEIIEAHWLFGIPISAIEVVVHPQSIIHSMVRFRDGSLLAQLGLPDMRLPIQYALLYPERLDARLPRLDPVQMGALTFEAMDARRFPAVELARKAAGIGGTMPAVMNAANEEAVGLFLDRQIPFTGIMEVVERVMELHEPLEPTYENVLEADAWARQAARRTGRLGQG
ncbi:MAG: 1-deoxy-D-xylulose-5-phosphate reductoisomerase [Chthonomonadales bacterium]